MNPKYVLIIVIVLTIAVSVFAFGNQSQLTNLFGFERQAYAQTASQIPNHILYDKLFRMIMSFKKKAESQEMSAERRIGLTNYFKNRAKLTIEENEIRIWIIGRGFIMTRQFKATSIARTYLSRV